MTDINKQIDDALLDRGREPGLSTGMYGLDQYLGGFKPGKSYLFSGVEKSGKTTFLINLLSNMINKENHVGIISTELNMTQITRKLKKINDIDHEKDLDKTRDYKIKMKKHIQYAGVDTGEIVTNGIIDIKKLINEVEKQAFAGAQVIVIDNLTAIQNQADWKAMASAGQQIVTLTKKLKAAVVVVAHTKPGNVSYNESPIGIRNLIGDGRAEEIFDDIATIMLRPTTNDIYGGGGFCSQFDGVILFWRPFQKFDKKDLKEKTAVIVDSLRDSSESKGSNLVRLIFDEEAESYKELGSKKKYNEALKIFA